MSAQELAIVSTAGLPISQRIMHVLVAYNHYIVAMFAPLHLAVFYPYQFNIPKLAIGCAIIVLAVDNSVGDKKFAPTALPYSRLAVVSRHPCAGHRPGASG